MNILQMTFSYDDIFKCISFNENYCILTQIAPVCSRMSIWQQLIIGRMLMLHFGIWIWIWLVRVIKPLPEPVLIKISDAVWCH